MPRIYVMPPHLADLIAAGEVVERPCSVVKELVENSIDAGATVITVEIRSGGMAYIRVTDNGCGMSPEDGETAFLRHATSKLRTQRDLEAIGTLGFRGEALAAIGAVSRVELTTREKGGEGVRLTLESGALMTKEPAGCPEGTTIIIRDLFFNTPARLKFMKNDKAEGAAVTAAVQKLALSHPEVSIRYIKDDKEELHTPGDGRVESAVYTVLGRDTAKSLLPVRGENGSATVTGFVCRPANCRGNRNWQFFFLNGRIIKSRVLQAALEQAYKNSLFTGKFPVCVLDIRVNPSAVDVNVHPTKSEVRFSDERPVFDAVYWAVKGALEQETPGAPMELSPSTEKLIKTPEPQKTYKAQPRDDFFKTVPSDVLKNGKIAARAPKEPVVQDTSPRMLYFKSSMAEKAEQTSLKMPPVAPIWEAPDPAQTTISDIKPREQAPAAKAPETPAEPQTTAADAPPSWRYIGEALETYLVVEKGRSIFLIDKHAAHERILFNKLKNSRTPPEGQRLLTPIPCQVGEEAVSLIDRDSELLLSFGIEAEAFGGDTVLLRQVPADIRIPDPEGFMEEIAEALRLKGRVGLEETRDKLMHSVACKAAIKAGSASERRELTDLIERVISGEVRYCPHGRPVSLELTGEQIDKSFKRT